MRKQFVTRTLPLCAVLFFAITWIIDAGPLTPPSGPITSTGRFGPRIDILTLAGDADSLHRITQRGSYYLSGNLQGASGFHGIEIATSNVTIDLNGYTLSGGTGSLDGIRLSGAAGQVRVVNGILDNRGGAGINLSGANTSRVERTISRNCGGWGVRMEPYDNAVTDCTTVGCGGSVTNTGGIYLGEDSSISGCVSNGNTGNGLEVLSRSIVEGSTATFNTGMGFKVAGDSLVRGNISSNNTGGNQTTSTTKVDNHGL